MSAKAKNPPTAQTPPAADEGTGDPAGYQELLESISGIAECLQSLNRQAVREYTPVVEGIIRFRSRDARFIDHTLDGLLDFCAYEPALALFKKLCRYYWDLDPVATAGHINACREHWDSDDSAVTGDTPQGGKP